MSAVMCDGGGDLRINSVDQQGTCVSSRECVCSATAFTFSTFAPATVSAMAEQHNNDAIDAAMSRL
jgi:hypothetical protein